MNGNFYSTPTFPNVNNNNVTPPGNVSVQSTLPLEQSLIENILRLNKGKRVKAYVAYPDSTDWRDKIYDGYIEEAGRDHLILRDATTNNWYLIRMLYVNFVEFNEKISYSVDYSDTFN